MQVATSLINSTYGQYLSSGSAPRTGVSTGQPAQGLIESNRKGLHDKGDADTARGKRAGKAAGGFDQVNLSKGLSLEKINSLLTTHVGQKVDTMLKDAGIDIRAAAGLDWSPEATAGRIFDMTTGLFEVWRGQHPDMSEEELIDSFENVIRKSVDQGASEAIAIISASGLDDGVIQVAQDTMSILHEKYDGFFAGLRDNLEEEPSAQI